jgi:hypothetical protein
MPIDFPDSPEVNDIFSTNNTSWIWTGSKWNVYATSIGTQGPPGVVVQAEAPSDTSVLWFDTDEPAVVGPTGPAGETGPQGPEGPTGPQGPAGTVLIEEDNTVIALRVFS